MDTYFCLYSQGTCSFTTDTHNYNLNTNHSVVVNCKIHWLCNELSILLVRAKHEEKGGLYSKRRNLSLKFPTRLEFLACWLCSSDSERKKARLSGKISASLFLKKRSKIDGIGSSGSPENGLKSWVAYRAKPYFSQSVKGDFMYRDPTRKP